MVRKLKNRVPLPEIDGKAELGKSYFTKRTRIDPDTIQSKKQINKEFKSRFGYDPEVIFYGQPNGSILYAGPLTRNPGAVTKLTAVNPGDLQPTLSQGKLL